MPRRTAHDVGRIRTKLADKIERQLQADGFSVRVDPADLWPAQGRWRSDVTMDVMPWEGQVELDRGFGYRRMGIGSWETMTDLCRQERTLRITFDGLDFEVG